MCPPVLDRWKELSASRGGTALLCLVLASYLSLSKFVQRQHHPFAEMVFMGMFALVLSSAPLRDSRTMWTTFAAFLCLLYLVACVAVVLYARTGWTFWYPFEMAVGNEHATMLPTTIRIVSAPIMFMIWAARVGLDVKIVVSWGSVLALASTAVTMQLMNSMFVTPARAQLSTAVWCIVPTALTGLLIHNNEKHLQQFRALSLASEIASQRELKNQLMAAESQRRTVGYIFHEVRNPLNNITLASELALDLLETLAKSTPPQPSPLRQATTSLLHQNSLPITHSAEELPDRSDSFPNPHVTRAVSSLSELPTSCQDSPQGLIVTKHNADKLTDHKTYRQHHRRPLHSHTLFPSTRARTHTTNALHDLFVSRTCGEICELVEDIHQSTNAAVRVLNDALNLQKLESGAFEFVHKPFLLADLVTFTTRMVAPQMRAKRISMNCTIDPQLKEIAVNGDFHRLQQVLLNFLTNAFKFTPPEGVVEVLMTVIKSDLQAEVSKKDCETLQVRTSVRNTGQGISDEDKAKIFQPWSQIRAGEQQQGQGSGLGLALCKAFVEQGHKGKVGFESTVGETTEFFFDILYTVADRSTELLSVQRSSSTPELKLQNHNTSPHLVNNNSNSRRGSKQRNSGEQEFDNNRIKQSRNLKTPPPKKYVSRVLVVEDSSMSRKLLAKTLNAFGVLFEECTDGQEAVEKVKQLGNEHFCFVLMDKEMPRMDGFEATKQLRKLGFDGAIVGCTGNAMDDQVSEFLSVGADHVLGKPITQIALKQALEHFGIVVKA